MTLGSESLKSLDNGMRSPLRFEFLNKIVSTNPQEAIQYKPPSKESEDKNNYCTMRLNYGTPFKNFRAKVNSLYHIDIVYRQGLPSGVSFSSLSDLK